VEKLLIRWHGHACFEIVDSAGYTIAIDPHDGYSVGMKPPSFKADAVLITHEHFDHNAYNTVAKPGAERYSMKEGEFVIGGKHRARGVRFYHDKVKGRRRGEVVAYKIEVEGVGVLHLGDLGHVPDEKVVADLKPIDVLMVPIGGTFTIDPREAFEVIKIVDPKIVIPMHYWVRGINLPLQPVDVFVDIVKDVYDVVRAETNTLSTTADELHSITRTRVHLLSPPS